MDTAVIDSPIAAAGRAGLDAGAGAGAVPAWHWRKLGQVFDPREHREWAGSHAQVPTVLVLPDRLRVYYAARGADGRSYPTFIDLDRDDPTRLLGCHRAPVLGLGAPGTFDDEGVMPAWVHQREGRVWMYYSGWNRRLTVPYHNATGLAVSEDGGVSFRRAYEGPVLDRTPEEPYLAVTPWIECEPVAPQGARKPGQKAPQQPGAAGNRQARGPSRGPAPDTGRHARWQAWYISGERWVQVDGRHEPVYVIRHARSDDGVHWHRNAVTCVEQAHPLEAFSHPTVLREGGRYHLWYCHRHSIDYRDGRGAYRIGYAWSDDGERFQRCDAQSGIAPSAEGWDSTMLCYPSIVRVGPRTYLFYNGNGFGQSGIGVAVLDGQLPGRPGGAAAAVHNREG
ncbi:MAG: hypothetical protein ACK515_29305 [bacterium]|jgi:hypothetical protein|nr:hypothetical protein [Betaproteobacteria bacterium]